MKKTYLFLTETDFSLGLTGAHRRFLELVNGIAKNQDVILISPRYPNNYLSSHNIKWYPLINIKFLSRMPSSIKGSIAIILTLIKLRPALKYDYAIAFSPLHTVCLYFSHYKDIISLFREDFIQYKEKAGVGGVKLFLYKLIERLAVRESEKIIVQCKNDKKSLIDRNYKVCNNVENKTYIQINNINASWIRNEPLRFNSCTEVTSILFIGNFSSSLKGHELLLPVIKDLLDQKYRLKLYVAGDGKTLGFYKKKFINYPEIVFLGRVNNVYSIIQKADFEIVPSLIDSCPNVILEGLSAGIAVYGSRVGGIPDLLINPKFMFEPTYSGIYDFLIKIISSKRYLSDSKEQQILKKELEFDWVSKIQMIIEENSFRRK